MKLKNFNELPQSEKELIFQEIGTQTGIPSFAVEKDWWVVQILSIVFEMDAGKHIVFKGGTSLSKAWNLIERFSEDIDLTIDREFLGFSGELSKKQRTNLRKIASAYTGGRFLADLQNHFKEKGISGVVFNLVETESSDQDPRIIEVYYPNVIPPPGYLQPKVQIEVGCRSFKEPFTLKSFGSLVDEGFPDREFAQPYIQIPSVNPERTFLEKIFLLHEEFQRPPEKMRVDRFSRHLYDVVKLSETEFCEKALNDQELYSTIVEHRHKFTRVGGVNYNLHQPQTIHPIPPSELLNEWKTDYEIMVNQMIYEQKPPSFEKIMEDLGRLKQRINDLPWKFAKEFPESGI